MHRMMPGSESSRNTPFLSGEHLSGGLKEATLHPRGHFTAGLVQMRSLAAISSSNTWKPSLRLPRTVRPELSAGVTETDGSAWSELGTVELAQAPGLDTYPGIDVALEGIVAKYVKITALSNWSLLGLTQKGLSEVRFFAIPVYAREPQPDNGVTTDRASVTLQWRSGREAASHEVILSSDSDAVQDSSARVGTTNANTFTDITFVRGSNKLNAAGLGAIHAGPIDLSR